MEWETVDQWEKGIAGSGNRKSRDLEWETADQWEKRIAGSGDRKSRDLGWETADQWEKGIAGTWWGKTADQRGRRVQSPIQAPWEVHLLNKKRRHVGNKK